MARVVKIQKKNSTTVVTTTESGVLQNVRIFNKNHNVFFDYLNNIVTVTGCSPPLTLVPSDLDPTEHIEIEDVADMQVEFENKLFFINTEGASL